jgi:hypothetical protein
VCGGCVGLTTLPPSVRRSYRQCGILNILIWPTSVMPLEKLVRPEGLGTSKKSSHRGSNPRPSGLKHSTITTTPSRALWCKLYSVCNLNYTQTTLGVQSWRVITFGGTRTGEVQSKPKQWVNARIRSDQIVNYEVRCSRTYRKKLQEPADLKPRQENMADNKYCCIVGHKQTDGTKWKENKLFYKKNCLAQTSSARIESVLWCERPRHQQLDTTWGSLSVLHSDALQCRMTEKNLARSPHDKYSSIILSLHDSLCGLVVRVPGYTTEMYCASCEVRTEFIYVM